MYQKLYNGSGQLKAVLDNIIKETAFIKRVVNGEFTFNFEAFEKELKSEYFDTDNNLVVDNQTFDIKYIEQDHEEGEVKYSIQCEHVNYRMEDGEENLFTSYTQIGTPTQILTQILSGTEFNVGVIEFTDVITVSATSEITRKALIYQLANALGGEIDYTNYGFTINILASIGQNRGFQARFGKNLKGVKKIIDSRGGLKTYYSVDIIELKNSNEYIEKQLQDLEVVDAGDAIQIIDPIIGLNIENRVLSIEKNPIFEINTKLEIVNTLELITDKINQIETNSVQQDKLYNNVAISKEYGFRASRSDQLARATLGGGTISLDKGDGNGGYIPSLYFDVISGKYKVIGDIIMEGGSISWDDVIAPSAEQVGARPDWWVPTAFEVGARPDDWMPSASDVGAISSTYIDANGVFTPNVYATHISTLLGKITTAQIENLEVGSNVTMGPNATISWSKVTNQPSIPSQYTDYQAVSAWEASGYSTYINSNGVYTGKLYAQHAVINNGAGTGSINMDVGTSSYVIFKTAYTTGGNTLMIGKSSSVGGTPSTMERIDAFANWLYLYGSQYISGTLYCSGDVDFTDATVTGITAKFG